MPTPAISTLISDLRAAGGAPTNTDYITGPPPGIGSPGQAPAHTLIETAHNSATWESAGVLEWTEIVWPIDGEDRTCALQVKSFDGQTVEQSNTWNLLNRVLDDERRIRIDRPQGVESQRIIFQGYPMVLIPQWDSRRNAMSIICFDEGQETLRTNRVCQIGGRIMRFYPLEDWDENAPDAVEFEALPAIFNANGKPNRSATRYPFQSFDDDGNLFFLGMFTHDDDPTAVFWSYYDAYAYLLYHYVHKPLATGGQLLNISSLEFLQDTRLLSGKDPLPGAADPFVRFLLARPNGVSIQSTNVEEALVLLGDASGLHHQIDSKTVLDSPDLPGTYRPFVRVFATVSNSNEQAPDVILPDTFKMRRPSVRWIPKSPDFRWANPAYTSTPGRLRRMAASTAAISGVLNYDRRKVDDPIFWGGAKDYEVTLLLRPWWEPVPNLDEIDPADSDAIDAALVFWDGEFSDTYRDSEEVDRQPVSRFHSLHPLHHTAITPAIRAVGGFIRTSGVFRLWGFPDSAIETDAANLARLNHQWADVWGAPTYGAYNFDSGGQPTLDLMYVNGTFGGALPPSIVENWAPIRRPFGNRISRESPETTDVSPLVRFHFGVRDANGDHTTAIPEPGDDGWVTYAGKATIYPGRALIRLDEGDIWTGTPFLSQPDAQFESASDMSAMKAYIEGHFWVSITCTVRGDRRLKYAPAAIGGIRRPRRRTVDLGFDQFVIRDRDSGNSFLGVREETDSEFSDRDDEAKLKEFAEAQRQAMKTETVAGSFDMFFMDTDLRPGDSMRGCAGLTPRYETFPWVKAMTFSRTSETAMTTSVVLTDERSDPDLGAEGPV